FDQPTPSSSARRVQQRRDEYEQRRQRKHPPGGYAVVRGECGQAERRGDADGDAPVVADDEVVPELEEPDDVPHAATAARSWRMRSRAIIPSDITSTKASTPSRTISPPGHSTPVPSAPQQMPKLVSMT